MIRTTGESTPRSVANNPNYNPAIFGQGPKTDFLGRGLMERIQADAKKQRELEEALNPPGFIPIEARRPPSGGSDFRDVLNSMGYARGGKVVRQADGSLKSFNPVRLGGRDYYQEYMDRQSRPPQKAAAPKKEAKAEVPSKDAEDKKAMKEAKKDVKLESKKETLDKASSNEEE